MKIKIKDETEMTIKEYKEMIKTSKIAINSIKKDIKKYKLLIKQAKIINKVGRLGE